MQCYFPNFWKLSYIIPVPKTTPPDKNEVRPISLLSAPSKMLEKVMIRPIKELLQNNYGEHQFGFKSHSSTTCALLFIQNCIINELEKDSTRNVLLMALDFSKAFDRVHHDLLLRKLDFLPKNSHKMIQSYLQNRRGCIKIGEHLGNPFDIISSVPQGSVIGPLLWCVFISDLQINNDCIKTVKFADDTSFIVTIKKDNSAPEETIRDVMKYTLNWSERNKMTLNCAKTKGLNISFCVDPWIPDLILKAEINFVSEIKILGITFNDKLNWKNHIDNIVKLGSQRLVALRILRSVLDKNELLDVYCATIRCLYEYCCQLFVILPQNLSDKLNKLFKRSHKIICGNCDCVNDIESRWGALSLKLFKSVLNNNNHTIYEIMPSLNRTRTKCIIPFCRTNRKLYSFAVECAHKFNSD